MTWTYDVTRLSLDTDAGVIARMRLALQDTDSSNQLFQDEELLYFRTLRNTQYGACAEAARALSAKYSSAVDSSIDGLRANFSQKQAQWAERAIKFDELAAVSGGVIPYSGGISQADMEAVDQDEDRVRPQFAIGMMDDNLIGGPKSPTEDEVSGGG